MPGRCQEDAGEQVSCPTSSRCFVALDNRFGSVQSVTLH
jgi:hypothetical protein